MNPSAHNNHTNGIHSTPDDLFRSFFMGGFECSTQRLPTGRRLDLVHATRHDRFCELDYRRMLACGLRVAREGLRWHLIEKSPGDFDFSTALPIVRAARSTGMQIIWDLCHYGWPDDIDIFKPEFVRRFARLADAFARWLSNETDDLPLMTPVNEISFFAWAAGDTGAMHPNTRGRAFELKVQLARAAIEAMEAAWAVLPRTRFALVDPIIHVIAHPNRPEDIGVAAGYRESQFQGWDLLSGRLWPQIGGSEKYLDLIGLNYYPDNQWIKGFGYITREHPLYMNFSHLIAEVYARYQRPIFISETGAEDGRRPGWLRYICDEVDAALKRDLPVKGICLYPIVNYPGWENERHCHNGLWDYADDQGEREICGAFAEELHRQRLRFEGDENASPASRTPDSALGTSRDFLTEKRDAVHTVLQE